MKIKMIFAFALITILTTGCEHFKKLTGGDNIQSNTLQIQGNYQSNAVALNGSAVRVSLYLLQSADLVYDGSLNTYGTEQLHATPEGTINGNHVHLILSEGVDCPNKITGDGDFSGNTLVISFSGLANSQAGCYPKDVNFSATLGRP